MRLPLSNVENVIVAYIDEELMPKATPPQKWITTFVGVAFARNASTLLESNSQILKSVGMIDNDGIDMERVRDYATEAFAKSGPVEVGGVILSKEDVPIVYNIAKRFAKE